MRLALVLPWLLMSCTFGGSKEDPRAEEEPTVIPVVDASEPELTPEPAPIDAAKPAIERDAGDAAMAVVDAGTPRLDASLPQVCEPQIPTCDPVHNTGCPPLTQCDVDTEASAAAGRCVFYQAPLDSNCSANALNTTCEGQTTCVANACRKVCYCDADCGPTDVCADPAPGPAGPIKLCRPR